MNNIVVDKSINVTFELNRVNLGIKDSAINFSFITYIATYIFYN